MSAFTGVAVFFLEHRTVVEERIVPFSYIGSIKRRFNNWQESAVGYIVLSRKEEMKKYRPDIGFDTSNRLVKSQGGNGRCRVGPDTRQGD
jgi:hypothetical protein